MHFLLTGGTGFIGQRLARRIIERGDTLTVLVRRTSKRGPLEQLGALCDSFDSVLMELKRVELKSMCAAAGVSNRGRKLELVLRLMGKEIKAPTPEEERWRTAIHEAGHVLLNELYDLDYSGVTLNPEEQAAAGLVMRVPMASLLASKTSSAVELRGG